MDKKEKDIYSQKELIDNGYMENDTIKDPINTNIVLCLSLIIPVPLHILQVTSPKPPLPLHCRWCINLPVSPYQIASFVS